MITKKFRKLWMRTYSTTAVLLITLLLLCGCSSDTANDTSAESHTEAVSTETTELAETIQETQPVSDTVFVTESDLKETETPAPVHDVTFITLDDIPNYNGNPYAVINDNVPFFSNEEYTTDPFEIYSDLDNLGRCQVAFANICKEIMPTEERESISEVHPSGWQSGMDWERCHLIGFQLAGENANEKNLVTGTHYMNVTGMLPFENMIADYVKETDNHVLYRVTPMFKDDELVCRGVLMEAASVEDDDILFNIFCYNMQPGEEINYQTGVRTESGENTNIETEVASNGSASTGTYILNTNTKKFHYPDCSSVDDMKEKNKKEYTGSRKELINQGYSPCGRCNP